MQDKNNITNIDEQFTDLGWENMRGILDVEMPVVPVRKSRWGWLWLLILLPSLFILGIMIYFGIAVWQDEKRYNETPDTAIANVIENTNDIDGFEESNKVKSPRTDDFSRRRESSHLTAKVVSTDASKKELETAINENNLDIKKDDNFNYKNPNSTQTYDFPIRTNDFPESSYGTSSRRRTPSHLTAKVVGKNIPEKEPTKNIIPPIVAIENSTRNLLGSIERVATLPLGKISLNNLKINKLAAFDPIPKSCKFSQTYSVLAGVRSDEFTDFGGVNVGLLAHYRFTPKLGLETGLTYNNLRKKINTNVDYTDSITLQYPDNTQQFDRTLIDALNLHYLRLPLALTYRPHAKIQLGAGINSGYRFVMRNTNTNSVSSSEINTMDGGSIIVINDTYESSFEVNAENIELDTNVFSDERIDVPYSFIVRKWDLAAHAGLRYYPTPRLGIDLSYQYGLFNMTPNSTVNRNSGLQLALVYQIHR